jgi:hypothetical protein
MVHLNQRSSLNQLNLNPLPEKDIVMNGTAVFGEPVVVIKVDNGDVRLKTGRIVSDGSSHVMVDNRYLTVVRDNGNNGRTHPTVGLLGNAHEKEFRVDDIHLLKAPEAEALRDPAIAHEWFGCIYQDWVVSKIQRRLKRLKM